MREREVQLFRALGPFGPEFIAKTVEYRRRVEQLVTQPGVELTQ